MRLGLRAGMHLRNHDAQVDSAAGIHYVLNAVDYRFEMSGGSDLPMLRMKTTPRTGFTYDPKAVKIEYPFEKHRGYAFEGSLWSPGYFRADLEPGSVITLTASTEPWEIIDALPYEEVRAAELLPAARARL